MNAIVRNADGIPVIETWDAMTRRHFNERAEVLRYLADGRITSLQAGKVLGREPGCLRKFIARNGLGIKFRIGGAHKSGPRAETFAKILSERTALSQREPHITCKQGAKELGVSYTCLRTYSARHGIKWKPVGEKA